MKSIGFEKFVWQTLIEFNEVLAAIQESNGRKERETLFRLHQTTRAV